LFPAALSSGRRLSSAHFTAVFPGGASGYAVIVSKKTARLSVARHRIKRRVLAALRSIAALPPALLIFPKSSVQDMAYRQVRDELASLLAKADHPRALSA
jgi:ribonuclease P protein component